MYTASTRISCTYTCTEDEEDSSQCQGWVVIIIGSANRKSNYYIIVHVRRRKVVRRNRVVPHAPENENSNQSNRYDLNAPTHARTHTAHRTYDVYGIPTRYIYTVPDRIGFSPVASKRNQWVTPTPTPTPPSARIIHVHAYYIATEYTRVRRVLSLTKRTGIETRSTIIIDYCYHTPGAKFRSNRFPTAARRSVIATVTSSRTRYMRRWRIYGRGADGRGGPGPFRNEKRNCPKQCCISLF